MIEIMMALATIVNQQEALTSKQLGEMANVINEQVNQAETVLSGDLTIQSTISDSFKEATEITQKQVEFITKIFSEKLLNSFKARTCVNSQMKSTGREYTIFYLAHPL